MIKLKGKSHARKVRFWYYELNSLHAYSVCKTVTRTANDVNAWDAHGFAHDEYA